jgi:hypothetical protein
MSPEGRHEASDTTASLAAQNFFVVCFHANDVTPPRSKMQRRS